MEAPLCDICNKRHWGRVCAQGTSEVKAIVKKLEIKPLIKTEEKKPFDRKEYQKNYMKSYLKKWRRGDVGIKNKRKP